MNALEKQLAESLLPCPHCGKAPNLDVIGLGDERDKEIETWFYRNLRLGKTYYRIECCAMMEGLDWDELSGTWNRREPSRKESLDEAMERLRARLKAKKAADALKPKRPEPKRPEPKPPRYDDVYFEGLRWLNGEPLPEDALLLEVFGVVKE